MAKNLAEAAAQAAVGLTEEVAKATKRQVREELVALLHAVLDASGYAQAEQALAALKSHSWGATLAQKVNEQFDRLLFALLTTHRGLVRIAPECPRPDRGLARFPPTPRPDRGHGRNHGSAERLERAALLWSIYHNFTPAQRRSERKRHYKHPGQSPLEVAGAAPGEISYLPPIWSGVGRMNTHG